jgi:hypothetical protein
MRDEERRRNLNGDDDPNAMLHALLLRVDGIIDEVRRTSDAQPHFTVEATLRKSLRDEFPDITFTDADISSWAAKFSS